MDNMDTSEPCSPQVLNPHILFGTFDWSHMSHEDQAKVIESRRPYLPVGPTTDAFSTPPSSPAAKLTPSTGPRGMPVLSAASKSSGATHASPTYGRYVARLKAELAAQQEDGKVVNTHLSFGHHNWQMDHPQRGQPNSYLTDPGHVNNELLARRGMHQEEQGSGSSGRV